MFVGLECVEWVCLWDLAPFCARHANSLVRGFDMLVRGVDMSFCVRHANSLVRGFDLFAGLELFKCET